MTQRYFEDFTVGDRFKSPSRTLTDAHFLFFAGMTGDNHPIHYDDEYGKKTRYGGRLTHGLLLASLTAVGASTLAPLVEESIVAFVEQATRFRAPVLIGDTIYPEHEVVGLDRKRSAGLLTLRVALRNQRGEVGARGRAPLPDRVPPSGLTRRTNRVVEGRHGCAGAPRARGLGGRPEPPMYLIPNPSGRARRSPTPPRPCPRASRRFGRRG